MAEERSGTNDHPATHGFAITPTDQVELVAATRMIYVGGAGNINLVLLDDTSPTLLTAVPVGTTLRVRARQVWSTSTTATLLIGLY